MVVIVIKYLVDKKIPILIFHPGEGGRFFIIFFSFRHSPATSSTVSFVKYTIYRLARCCYYRYRSIITVAISYVSPFFHRSRPHPRSRFVQIIRVSVYHVCAKTSTRKRPFSKTIVATDVRFTTNVLWTRQ